jgi:tetratricopeptide (TPR) repeat protein
MELSFISADFYYELGFISEARHWAYESLVYAPYSPRALQLLVKVHLVNREYRAAERCLDILHRGLVSRGFVRDYMPYVKDTVLTAENREIVEKRGLIPAEKELSPFIDERFRELLEASDANRLAYEYLMLYYLLDAQLDSFMELYKEAGKYFDHPVELYEEAILVYGETNDIPVTSLYSITPATLARFDEFNRILGQYSGNRRMARNVLYWEMGKSYMYYFHFLFPRIIKPEIIREEDEEPAI